MCAGDITGILISREDTPAMVIVELQGTGEKHGLTQKLSNVIILCHLKTVFIITLIMIKIMNSYLPFIEQFCVSGHV